MFYLKQHYQTITIKELYSNFYFNSILLPKILFINLNIGINNINYNKFLIIPTKLSLELIINNSVKNTISKKNNLYLKIKKNQIVGINIKLHKKKLFFFLLKLIIFILPNEKNLLNIQINQNIINFKIQNLLNFPELEKYFNLFQNINNLNILIKTNTKNLNENKILLRSLKIPLK